MSHSKASHLSPRDPPQVDKVEDNKNPRRRASSPVLCDRIRNFFLHQDHSSGSRSKCSSARSGARLWWQGQVLFVAGYTGTVGGRRGRLTFMDSALAYVTALVNICEAPWPSLPSHSIRDRDCDDKHNTCYVRPCVPENPTCPPKTMNDASTIHTASVVVQFPVKIFGVKLDILGNPLPAMLHTQPDALRLGFAMIDGLLTV
ncbi:hypothetical protein DL95DRAFT_419046 [Leptodontidium sp. 2 PMI_412]|nr:hypothetical protein DL95DRAFT_419046 [Leptodontidium sp. 2 PMI_412]